MAPSSANVVMALVKVLFASFRANAGSTPSNQELTKESAVHRGFHQHRGKLLLVNTKAFGGNGEDFEINNHTIFCPASIYVFKLLTSCSILDHFPTIFCIFKKQNDTYFLL